MSMIEKEKEEAGASRAPGSLPWGFEQRAKVRDAEAKAYGAAEAALRAKANMSSMSNGEAMNQMNPSSSLPPPAFATADRHAPPPAPGPAGGGARNGLPLLGARGAHAADGGQAPAERARGRALDGE